MKNKYFHLFSFNTYEHNVYIKEFRFFHFQFNPFKNLTHWKHKSHFPEITSFRWSPFRSKHSVILLLFEASPQELMWLLAEFDVSTPELCGVLELWRLEISDTPEKEITCWKIGWPGWPCDVPISGDNMFRKQIPHSYHGISCGVARNSILSEKHFFGYWMTSKLKT